MKSESENASQLSDAAKNARRNYYREYRAKNRERIRKKSNERWERIARQEGSRPICGENKQEG